MTSCNRLCPSVEGSASPLITHRIGVDVCLARQRTFFHKCHRCVYRGKAATWEPEPVAVLELSVPEAPASVGIKRVDLAATRAGKAAKAAKADAAAKAASAEA